MPRPHFVEDYEKLVRKLKASHPLDEAMSLAIGGNSEILGDMQVEILARGGLSDGMSIVDIGCGSGRTARPLAKKYNVDYLGIDVVQDLLDYAASTCPPQYKFEIHTDLTIPSKNETVDIAFAFSVFTHLLHEETFILMQEAHRALVHGGKLIFSFLEFRIPSHWSVFEATVNDRKSGASPHLNMFIERNAIDVFARLIGFEVVEILDGDKPHFGEFLFGQSIATLKKP